MNAFYFMADHFWFSLVFFMFLAYVIRMVGRGLKWLIEYAFTPSEYPE